MITTESLLVLLPSVYLASALLIALTLGALFSLQPRALGGSFFSRFLIGIAIYPTVVGVLTMALMLMIPGHASGWFVLTPALLCASVVLLFGQRFLPLLRSRIRRWLRTARSLEWLSVAALCVLILSVGMKLMQNAASPFVEHDALVYAYEALRLATLRSGDGFALPWSTATVVAGHPHTALYQAYLAHALLFSPSAFATPEADITVRIAVQLTLVGMLLAIASLASHFRVPGGVPIALLLTLMVADFGYLSYASSRDGFRIGSLLAFAFVLIAALRRRGPRIPLILAGALVLTAAAASAAHTLNVVGVALASATWFIVSIIRGLHPSRLAYVGGACALGLAIPALHYLSAFMATGRAFGDGFFYYAYAGTPLWEAWTGGETFANARTLDPLARLVVIAGQGSLTLFVLGITAALLQLVMVARRRRGRRVTNGVAPAAFLAGFTLMMLIPLTGLLDIAGVSLATMHVVNFRYFLIWYPLAALCLIAFLAAASIRFRRTRVACAVLLIASALMGTRTVLAWNVQQSNNIERYGIGPMVRALEQETAVRRVWVDHAGLRYYIRAPAVFAYQPPGSSVLAASSRSEAREILQSIDISHVLITEPIKGWWDRTALYSLLDADSTLVSKAGLHALYRLNSRTARQPTIEAINWARQ